MSHFALLWKARTIEKYRLKYEKEKINSIIMSNAEIPDKTLFQRWRHYRHDMSRHISRTFSKWYPEGSTVSNLLIHFRADMKFPQILLRSLFGFIGGLVLTYLGFIFLVFQLSLSLVNATVLSSIIGVVLTLGLTLSNRMRCLMFLLIPQLFSRVGRYTLTCYALVLILTGPATNTLKNLEVLSESMACSQEQIKISYHQLDESIKKPFNSIKQSLDLMIMNMKQITHKLKTALISINRLFISIASIIQSTYSWLDSVTELCHRKTGNPYEKCKNTIIDTAKKSPQYNYYESLKLVSNLAEASCKYLKSYTSFCLPANYADETFLATMKRKVKNFTHRISKLVYLHVQVHQTYSFIGHSDSDGQVSAGIVTEIRNRADPILTWLSWSSCVTSLFLLLIIFRAKHYQRMYESRSRFDNRFITKEFRELDLKRLREGRETVLPLNKRERAKYVTTTSFRLVASEKLYINRSVIFMIITTFKLMIHIVADYSLYWVLMTIRYHGSKETPLRPGVPDIGARVTGKGFVARFLSAMIETLNIPLLFPINSNKECLPNPNPPDYKRYAQIGVLIILLWFFALFEPYGLRLRHLIVGHYRPERAKARAMWLYQHILRTRGSFMKLARRKLHREYKYSDGKTLTFRYWLKNIMPIVLLRRVLGLTDEKEKCVLCYTVEEAKDPNTRITRCEVTNCPGRYCVKCFSDIGQMCTICLSPLDYIDLSDVSMEKGSSDDDSNDGGDSNRNSNNSSLDNIDGDSEYTEYDSDTNSSKENKENTPLLKHNINKNTTEHNKNNNNETSNRDNDINSNNKDSKKQSQSIICKRKIKTRFKSMSNNIRYLNNTIVYGAYIRFMLQNLEKFRLYKALRIFKIAKDVYETRKIHKRLQFRQNNIKGFKNFKTKNKLEGIVKCNKEIDNDKKKVHKKEKDKTTKQKENPKSEQNGNKKSKNNKNKPKKQPDDEKPKKSAKKHKTKSLSICKRRNSLPKMHNTCTRYWKSIVFFFFSYKKCRRNKTPSDTSKKQKKKKRRKKNVLENANEKDLPNDNHRIIAYLSELDWIMGQNPNVEPDHNLCEQKPDMIKVNDIYIPKLKLNFSSESVGLDQGVQKSTTLRATSSDSAITKRNEFSKSAIERYLTDKCYPSTYDSNLVLKDNAPNEMKPKQEVQKEEPIYEKSMRYFSLIGNNDFQENIDCKDFGEIEDFNQLLASSHSINKESEQANIDEIPVQGNDINITKAEDNIDKNIDPKIVQKSSDCKINKTSVRNLTDNGNGETKKESTESQKESSSTSSKWSRLRRVLSSRFPCVDRSLTVVKGLYNALLIPSEVRTCTGRRNRYRLTAEKGVNVCPKMCSCACQKNFSKSIENIVAHVNKTRSPFVYVNDAEVEANCSTCTCATQYYVSNRDVGTIQNFIPKYQESSESTNPSITDSLISPFHSSTESGLSMLSDDVTDTTIYSLAIDCDRTKKAKRTKFGNKATKSTVTKKKCVDVSTVTDWWSPLVEKKELKQSSLEGGKIVDGKSENISPSKRVVTFRSHAKIIPNGDRSKYDDVMSASRFLLESQKHYNELYSSKFYSGDNRYVNETQVYRQSDKVYSAVSRRYRRYHKAKRLEDSYSPRKVTKQKRTEKLKAN